MSSGAVLVGIAVLAVVAVYLARPFRPAGTAGIDRSIEAWVAQVQAEEIALAKRGQREFDAESTKPLETGEASQPINYCPQCGRRVSRGDRFCSGCGTQLGREA